MGPARCGPARSQPHPERVRQSDGQPARASIFPAYSVELVETARPDGSRSLPFAHIVTATTRRLTADLAEWAPLNLLRVLARHRDNR